MKNQKENQTKVFSIKEVNDFKRLCTVHQFKRRAINNNLVGVESLVIYLPEIFGATEKKLSNGSTLERIESKLNSLDIVLRCNDRTLGNLADSFRKFKEEKQNDNRTSK